MSLAAILGVAFVHLMAAMSPGPAFVLSVRTAASEGFRPAAGLALGFGLGAAIWATAALLGLSLAFEALPALLTILKVAGGLFLVWVAFGMWRHAPEPAPTPDQSAPRGTLAAIRLGLAAQLANPKPAVFFGAVFIGLVPTAANAGDKAIILANILWMETLWYVLTARIFSAPRARTLYTGAKLWLDRSMAGILAILGARIAIP